MTEITSTPADVARQPTHKQAKPTGHVDDVAVQIATLERELATARHDALVSRVMSDHGLTTEDGILLTGQDEATLIAQARRLQEQAGERQRSGPIARKEGQPVKHNGSTDSRQVFLTELGVSDDLDGW